MNILELQNVHKSIHNKNVLKGVDLQLAKGNVLGLIGENGAGKTTLLKTALGLLKTDSGEASLFNESAWGLSENNKEKLGFVPQTMEFFDNLKVKDLLEMTSSYYRNWDNAYAQRLIGEWQLDKKQNIQTLSEGQKQRLLIVLALSHSPQLLVLDEPVASLDPSARRAFIKELIELNADSETSIIFSTHITSDIERVAADVAFLQDGKIHYQGGVDELKDSVIKLHVQANKELPKVLPFDHILQSAINGKHAKVSVEKFDPSKVLAWEQELDASITLEKMSLEDIFLELNK
jgi:ABC-2 type transport system ATP-binding protein